MHNYNLLVLASSSPRRQELLAQIGVRFTVAAVDICESPLENELPRDYVSRMALEKAQQGLLNASDKNAVVMGADTSVVINQQILGKPENAEHLGQILALLSGETHQVLSAVAVINHQRQELRLSETLVSFRAISKAEINNYWKTGEPRDKAGGYAIQGLGAVFVTGISGSYSGVVGLPISETCELLKLFDIPWWSDK